MTFQTLAFIALLLAVLALYWLLGTRKQNLLLLAASYVFYGYVNPMLAALLAAFTLAMYLAGLGVAPTNRPAAGQRRLFLGLGVVSALGTLMTFKYLGFFVESAGSIVQSLGLGTFSNHLDIILPVGVSFYTLQSLGYVIDVYHDRVTARRNLLDFALFVSFFPQLVAGPIERASRLLPQFESRRAISAEDFRGAITLLLWGFFKKLVIADNVGVIADSVFAAESPGFTLLWVGVLAFGLQIFADFSGYTDIARGTARLFGIRLSINFNHPHIARSPADFWRRWHITLSTWFRDYVYIPLGGSRRGRGRTVLTIMVTFFLSGLWHGASMNFVLWGGYHGSLVVGERGIRNAIPTQLRGLATQSMIAPVVTFLLVTVGWLFFRETDVSRIWQLLSTWPGGEDTEELFVAGFLLVQVAIYSVPVWLHTMIDSFKPSPKAWLATRIPGRLAASQTVTATALFTGILLMRGTAGGEFIYFQF